MKYAISPFLLCAFLLTLSGPASAQEVDAFLACAEITDREQRLACLDEALDEATTRQGAVTPDAVQEPASVESFGETSGRVAEVPEAAEEAEEEAGVEAGESADRESFFRLPRIGNIFRRGDDGEEEDAVADSGAEDSNEEERLERFGREARVVVNENGEDELHDTISELVMARPNQWLIRLDSGQVWRQVYPKRLNLREGDAVRIYPTGWGDNYRLETPRLDGYIQVLRLEE